MKRFLPLLLALSVVLPLPALGAEVEKQCEFDEPLCTIEQTLAAPDAQVLLFWRDNDFSDPAVRSYELWLYWENDSKRLLLPSTVEIEQQYPTDRAPDTLALSEDGASLTYSYQFDAPLYDVDGQCLHEAGTYTYTADLATGELSVAHIPLPLPETGFYDVSPDDWFAPYVEVCVERGLMRGTGEGRFEPQRLLSQEECAVLALRLYDLETGGDGTFPAAPEDFGLITLSIEGGLELSGVVANNSPLHGFLREGQTWWWSGYLKFPTQQLSLTLTPEYEVLLSQHNISNSAAATATYCGVSYPGHVSRSAIGTRLFFFPNDPEALVSATYADSPYTTDPNAWYRDAWYYASVHRDSPNFPRIYLTGTAEPASRYIFASKVATVEESRLPAINTIGELPDLNSGHPIYSLYQAGILTGVDDYGSFNGSGRLTRVEAAAMLARVLEPQLRVRFEPFPLPPGGIHAPRPSVRPKLSADPSEELS